MVSDSNWIKMNQLTRKLNKKQPDHDDSASNNINQSYHIMITKSNGFPQPCLKKKKKSEENQWFPTAFCIIMDQCSLIYNIGIKQNMNEEV
jgi:hypothetical protein